MIVCSRNTVRESLHISFFCGRDPFCEVVRRPENTRGADRSAWVTSVSPLAWETSGPLPFAWATSGSLPSVQNYRPYIVFSSPTLKYEHPLRFMYFLFMAGYRELTNFRFFLVICWSYLRMKITVTLFISNKLYSRHHILYVSFLWKPLSWCYLATVLNLRSSILVYPNKDGKL